MPIIIGDRFSVAVRPVVHGWRRVRMAPGWRRFSELPFPMNPRTTGFTLVEILVVVLVVGILSAHGSVFYASVTHDAHQRGLSDQALAFFGACRERAIHRGIPCRVLIGPRSLVVADSPHLALNLPPGPDLSELLGSHLMFTASAVIDHKGVPLSTISLPFTRPNGEDGRIVIDVRPHVPILVSP